MRTSFGTGTPPDIFTLKSDDGSAATDGMPLKTADLPRVERGEGALYLLMPLAVAGHGLA